jgi:hypothetical protein
LRNLEDDWDGQGAIAIVPANLDSALAWVEQMRRWERAIPPSQVAPGVDGSVSVLWQSEGLYLEAEICQPNEVGWMLAVPGYPNRHWRTDLAIPPFVASFADLTGEDEHAQP